MPPDHHPPAPAGATGAADSDPCPRCGTAIPAVDTACAGCGFAVTPRREEAAARRFGLPRMAVGAIVVSTIEMAVLLWLLFGRRG
jgi:hypothetical protein